MSSRRPKSWLLKRQLSQQWLSLRWLRRKPLLHDMYLFLIVRCIPSSIADATSLHLLPRCNIVNSLRLYVSMYVLTRERLQHLAPAPIAWKPLMRLRVSRFLS